MIVYILRILGTFLNNIVLLPVVLASTLKSKFYILIITLFLIAVQIQLFKLQNQINSIVQKYNQNDYDDLGDILKTLSK